MAELSTDRPGLRGWRRALLVPMLAAGLSACATFGGGGTVEAIYTLSAPPDVADVSGRTNAQILIATPLALEALNTNLIAVRPAPSTLSYYPNVQWADRLPNVFQAVLANAFENTGRVKAVGLPGQSLLINYQIVSEIRAFQAETAGSDSAVVEVSVKILDDRNGRVRSSRIFRSEQPISGDSVGAAVGGMEAANQAVVKEIVRWTLATLG